MVNDSEKGIVDEHAQTSKAIKFKKWLKLRDQAARGLPSKSNQIALILFFTALNVEMALTIPGMPTGLGTIMDYLLIGSIYLLGSSVVMTIVYYILSFFYMKRFAGWLASLLFIIIQSMIILMTTNWGWLASSITTLAIVLIVTALSLLITYLYVAKKKSLHVVMMSLVAIISVFTLYFSVKGHWDEMKRHEYIKNYASFLLQDDHASDSDASSDQDSGVAADETVKDDMKEDNKEGMKEDAKGNLPTIDHEKQEEKYRLLELQQFDEQLAEHGDYTFKHYKYKSDPSWMDHAQEHQIYVPPMDGSTVLTDWSWMKKLYWGFTENEIAINGQLWVPEGEGPFPIVFIMHGNHISEADSSDGYAYLGELLASHGMIVSSIDANFLNYSVWSGIVDDDQKLRSWLMLAHIHQMKQLMSEADWDNVALIGHSRGGQAASMAVDAKQWYPNEKVVNILEDITIKAVIAIAPTDYYVDSKLPYLKNINYLTLHGTMDSDLTESFGERQYERTKFTQSGHFKATVELYHANHGQFNTVWGKYDEQFPGALALNTADLMSGDDQRLAAKLFIHSFLQASFNKRPELEAVFQDFRVIGHQLPLTGYVSRYSSSHVKELYSFERPQAAEEMASSSKELIATSIDLKGRNNGDKQNRVLWVSWTKSLSEIEFPITSFMTRGQKEREIEAIVISLARAERMVNPYEQQLDKLNVNDNSNNSNSNYEANAEDDSSQLDELTPEQLEHARKFDHIQTELETNQEADVFTGLPLTLKINARQWGEQSVDLSTYYHILHPAAHDFTKSEWLEENVKKGKYDVSVEPLLQTFVIPVSIIEQELPRDSTLFSTDLEKITLQFHNEMGSMIIDALGYIAKGGHYVEYSR